MANPVSPFTPKTSTPAPQVNLGGALKNVLNKIKPAPQTPLPTTQQSYNAAFPTVSKIGAANSLYQTTPQGIGVKAKAPEQNIQGPTTTITTAQQKTQPTQATGTTSQAPASQPVNNSGGTLNPNFSAQAPGSMRGTGQTTQIQPPAVSQGPYGVNPGLYGQLIASMANRSAQPSQAYVDATKPYEQAVTNLANFRRQVAGEQANISQQPIDLTFQQGRQQVLTQKAAQEDAALQNAVNQQQAAIGLANTQQGLQQQLLQQAAAGASPLTLSPGNYLQSPLTGGAADSQSGLQQGINSATQYAIAQQNIAQGQQYQGQAQQISNSLQLLGAIGPQLTNFMQNAGLNPNGVPIVNTQINKIDQQANPQAYATSRALLSEVQSFVQSMLQATGGMTPTDAGNLVASYDFSQLTPAQLSTFLQNMETAGNMRLSQAQSASQAGYGANATVGTPAQGVTPQQGTFQTGSANKLNELPDWLKALGGLGAGTLGAAGQQLQSQGGSFIAGGLAEKVLGL